VNLVGSSFGAQQGNGYVSFTDNGATWGGPGTASSLEVLSWSDTEITFMVPDNAQPGTTATVFVAVPSAAPGILRSNVVNLIVTAAPVITEVAGTTAITAISGPQASPGSPVTLTGRNFGATQGSGEVSLLNNGLSWGGPGDAGESGVEPTGDEVEKVAPLTVLNWSDTQISFLLPAPADGFAVTPGTTAALSVINAAGLSSNSMSLEVTSGVSFPVSMDSGVTEIGGTGNGHMQTSVTIEANGAMSASTHVWDTSGWGPFTGFHGATVVTIFDSHGNQLDQWTSVPIGVDGGQSTYVPWTGNLTTADLASLHSVSIVNFYDPQYQVPGAILSWIAQNGPAIAGAAAAIIGAF
jgi:hypothetical protein